jgi:signal transduction histidine kinase
LYLSKDLEDDKVKQSLESIQTVRTKKKFDFIREDMGSLLTESADGMNRVKEIVQNLKSFARLDEAEFKKTDINECIEITLKVIWNELKYKCTINKKMGKLPPLSCNPGQLNQVFMNLLENAAHAIKEHGDINIETEATETHIRICISDTGVGISRENIEKLFDPFFTTKPVGTGTGLGLSISYGIIEKHNGTIEILSEVGRGTKFIISLPINNTNNDDKGTI